MPNPVLTWTTSINQTLSEGAGGDQAIQYQEIWYAQHASLVAAGWTVLRSSDGTTASAANNIASASDVVIDVNTNAHTWAVYRSPADWLTGSDFLYLLFSTNNTAADTTPQIATKQFSTTDWDGGSWDETTNPTTTGTTTSVATSGDDIIPWTTATTGRYMTQYSSRGDWRFGVKIEGTGQWRHFEILQSMSDAVGGGHGDYRFAYYASSSASTEVLTVSSLGNATNWRGLDAGGNNNDNPEAACTMFGVGSWINGVDFSGQIVTAPIDLMADITGGRGRWLGTIPDLWGTSDDLPFGSLDDTESGQTQRRVSSASGIMLHGIPTADLPVV